MHKSTMETHFIHMFEQLASTKELIMTHGNIYVVDATMGWGGDMEGENDVV